MPKTLRVFFSRRMLLVFLMGFASGLPLALVGSTLKTWYTDVGVDLTVIGALASVSLPYKFKFLWSPFLDRYVPPLFGRRRGWMVLTQIGLILSLAWLSCFDPVSSALTMAKIAVWIAFLSATQDIAIDAYRREYLSDVELSLGISIAIMGYRIALLVAGSLALILADHIPWQAVYLAMAATMTIGLITTLVAPEPDTRAPHPLNLREAYIEPFAEFFKRPGAWWILSFILLYKLGDSLASEFTNTFYIKIGFTKSQIGAVAKLVGIWSIILGGITGGTLTLRIGLYRALWAFGILQTVTILGFVWLNHVGTDLTTLALTIGAEGFTAGMGAAAFAGFLAAMTNKKFTATQYALFSSLMGLPVAILGVPATTFAKNQGWGAYYVACTLLSIPGLLLLFKMKNFLPPSTREPAVN